MSSFSALPACTAILVAAGSSRRMGCDKLAAQLAGVPVLQRALEALLASEAISEVVVVCPQERWEWLRSGNSSKPVRRVEGGESRQESVASGLAALGGEAKLVAVHDGARALVLPGEITRCVRAAERHRAAALARRVTETLKRSDAEDFSQESISRENLWLMETPQAFEVGLLRAAYREVAAQGLTVTDEVSAVEALGVKVKLVASAASNLKITTPADLALAEALWGQRNHDE